MTTPIVTVVVQTPAAATRSARLAVLRRIATVCAGATLALAPMPWDGATDTTRRSTAPASTVLDGCTGNTQTARVLSC